MFAQHPAKRWKEGGVGVRKRRGHHALQQSQRPIVRNMGIHSTFIINGIKKHCGRLQNLANWTIWGKLSSDPPQTKVTNQMEANLSVLTASERALPVLQGHKLFNDF